MLVKARLAVGDVGWRVLVVAGALIHLATIVVAYRWYGGLTGALAALVTALVPAIPEVYWAVAVAGREQTLAHWYVLSVIGYPIVCALFLLGGLLFLPRSSDRPAD